MTLIEKAEELINNYYIVCQEFTEEIQCSIQAKQCALIAVDEILDCTKNGLGLTKFSKEYWQEVKEEIYKL